MKQKLKQKEFWIRLIILVIGLTIAHLGVTLFILSNLGSDPFNVMIQGLSRIIGISHGKVHIAVSVLLIIIILVIDKAYIKTGTLICMILGGPIIDGFTFLIKPVLNESSALVFRVIAMILGCVILAFGMTLVIKSDAGTGPNDLISVIISDKTKIKFGLCRFCIDLLFVIIGFVLGGMVGAGTVVCAFIVGPVAQKFMPISEGIVKKIVKK